MAYQLGNCPFDLFPFSPVLQRIERIPTHPSHCHSAFHPFPPMGAHLYTSTYVGNPRCQETTNGLRPWYLTINGNPPLCVTSGPGGALREVRVRSAFAVHNMVISPAQHAAAEFRRQSQASKRNTAYSIPRFIS